MRADDVAGAASLHCRVFPDYFLTHMGQRFVERFYLEFVDQARNYGLVAISDGELVGAVVGTLDYEGFFNCFYRQHFLRTAMTLLGRFLVDPYIRRNLVSRIAHVRQALRSVAARGRQTIPASEEPAVDQAPAHLLSVGVHPDWRGSGLAEELVDRYCDALWRDGWERVSLSVRPDNQRAVAFYEKTGWQRSGASAGTVQYTRSTRPAAGGSR
jgi:ribosomal protein S18 acetylase RimI-like enzyme